MAPYAPGAVMNSTGPQPLIGSPLCPSSPCVPGTYPPTDSEKKQVFEHLLCAGHFIVIDALNPSKIAEDTGSEKGDMDSRSHCQRVAGPRSEPAPPDPKGEASFIAVAPKEMSAGEPRKWPGDQAIETVAAGCSLP